MAKQRKSLPVPRLSTGSTSSSSAASNIEVGGSAREGSLSSAALALMSTPPTSVSEQDHVGSAVDKEDMSATSAADLTRRTSSRRKSGPASYNLGVLSGVRRTSAGLEMAKEKAARNFSGDTLVDDAPGPSSDTPNRKLLNDGVKALNMDWEMDNLPGDSASDLPDRKKRRHRSSMDMLIETTGRALGRVKSVLGKRDRDASETDKTDRRQSRRLLAIEGPKDANEEAQQDDDDTVQERFERVERPSKLARLSSSFSINMPQVFSTKSKKPTKRYETQGLYAGQSLTSYDDQSIPKTSRKPTGKARPLSTSFLPDATRPEKRTSLVALPMFSYLERERPFTIPYDVFAPVHHQRGEEKPKDWGKVHKNRFVGDARDYWRKPHYERSLCICTPPLPGSSEPGCGEHCLNRAMDYECDSNNCALGDQCTNRDFAGLAVRTERANKADKKSAYYLFNAGVEVIKTPDRGFGVRACRSYEPHEIITEYTGEIITPNEAGRRIREDYKDKADYYQMEFDQGMILDATKGSIARFVNHSCEPNCKMLKRFVGGHPRMALFAGDRGILTGEELTYDYNFDPYSVKNVQECRCGATNCRGVLGPRPKDANKPVTKKEKEGMAAGMKRKVGEFFGATPAVEVDKELFKKRKVPQMSKGWVYVDDTMEKTRIEEARKDKEIARLQKQGILPADLEVKKTTTTTTVTKDKNGARRFVQKVTTRMTGHRPKATPEAPSKKAQKPGRLSSIKDKDREMSRVDASSRVTKPARRSMDNKSIPKGSMKVRAVTKDAAKMARTMRAVKADD
ncbi:SET domain-containing protein [Aureobasidium sp. EXF-10728]|nr:SET domain-containing protein [Aureobasidium sp. EXF-10728]